MSEDNQILGTYLHGLFDAPAACTSLLSWAGLHDVAASDYPALREATLERLADMVEKHLDTERLCQLFDLPCTEEVLCAP